jgi:hypothetical protein
VPVVVLAVAPPAVAAELLAAVTGALEEGGLETAVELGVLEAAGAFVPLLLQPLTPIVTAVSTAAATPNFDDMSMDLVVPTVRDMDRRPCLPHSVFTRR